MGIPAMLNTQNHVKGAKNKLQKSRNQIVLTPG